MHKLIENQVRISVRNLVEFILRSGDIDNRHSTKAQYDAMQIGSRLHRKIQGSMPGTYKAEVSLKHTAHYRDVEILLEGRADGIITPDEKSVEGEQANLLYQTQTDENVSAEISFIIDEINRGEISKILGELFFSIDPGYRGKSGEVATQYSNMHTDPNEKFYIPENVYIIGTMNDIDRSVDSFDFAMRRRFRFVEVRAEDTQDMLESLEDEELKTEAIARMDKLNAEIIRVADLNENYQIGASYFLKLKVLGFDDLWTDYLQPLLQDYVRGLNDEEECMRRFAKAYGYTASGEGDSDEAAIN